MKFSLTTSNPNFVSDIRSAGRQLQLKSNGGKLPIYDVEDFEGFAESVWFLQESMTNILLFTGVKAELSMISAMTVRFSSFNVPSLAMRAWCLIHTQAVYMCMMKKTQWGHESYLFVKMVKGNMSKFTNCQVASANLVAGMVYLSEDDFGWIVMANLLKDNHETNQDVDVALKIWGPSVALLKGKTV